MIMTFYSVHEFLNAYSLLACTIALLWWYGQSSYSYWRKLNVKFLKPVPFFGNTAAYTLRQESIYETIDRIYKALLNEPFGGIYLMRDPVLIVKDPKLVSAILIEDFKNFHDRQDRITASFFNRNREVNPLDLHLVRAVGERWRILRQKMTPIFTSAQLKFMHDQIFYCVNLLIEKIEQQLDGIMSVDVATKQLVERLTVDVIGTCAFGIECNSLKSNDSFPRMCKELQKPRFSAVFLTILSFMGDRLVRVLNLRHMKKEVSDFFLNTVLGTIEYRRKNGFVRNDFLQLLMGLQNSHVDPKFAVQGNSQTTVLSNEKFDEIDIAANSYLFFFAGYETSAATFSFCLYELALNRDIQEKMRSEVQKIKAKYKILDYESLKEMTYLDAVIAETLRKYPFVVFLHRKCTKDYVIPETKVRIPAGTKIIIPVWSLHYDCRYYPNPDIFDPERFMLDNKRTRPRGVYLPFGDGPRGCIGKRFAKMELKAALSAIILKYEIKPCAKTEIPLKFKKSSTLLRVNNDIWINLSRKSM